MVPAVNAGVAVVAAVFLNAGATKLASSRPAAGSLQEVLRLRQTGFSVAAVRITAILELAVGVGLIFDYLRPGAALLAAGLGVCFTALGVLGHLRRATVPCGCVSAVSLRPIGLANVGISLGIIALSSIILTTPTASNGWEHSAEVAVYVSIATLVLCIWLNLHLVRAIHLKPVNRRG